MGGWSAIEMLVSVLVAIPAVLVIYFVVVTRLSLIWQSRSNPSDDSKHIYWVYKSPFLIRLTDHMFIVSAILLNHYSRLVDSVCTQLGSALAGKRVLQVSCAFGDVSQKIAKHCIDHGASELMVVDLVQSELDNAERKLKSFDSLCRYRRENATALSFEDQSYDFVVMFFLPHEVPLDQKEQVMAEANRVLKPGGKIIIGEFHKPTSRLLRGLGKLYFWIFEPYAMEMWGDFDIGRSLDQSAQSHYRHSKQTFCSDNFQVAAAEKMI